MFFKDFVSVKRQKIKRGASQTYDTPSKERIESYTRTYADSNIDDDIYAQMSEGSASGLFAHGHYDFDMWNSLRILKDKMHNKR